VNFIVWINRYGDIISSTGELSRDDRKILELLILKKGREMEWDKRSQEIRKALENDRLARMRVCFSFQFTKSKHVRIFKTPT